MSLSNLIRKTISLSNIDIYTFGKSSLYGYDSINHSIIVYSLQNINNLNDQSNDYLYLSSSPTWPIKRLILNEDETILALLADKIAYLVFLPKSNININKNSSSEGSSLCSVNRVPLIGSNSPTINCLLIDFIWLTSKEFLIVYTIPSSSECHLFRIESLKLIQIKHVQTFSVGLSSKNKLGTPNKKFSLHQSSSIIKLDIIKKKKKNSFSFFVLAMKTDGDFFILEIDQNQLLLNETIRNKEFQGPICILPSTLNNYGVEHGQSTFICLSNSIIPLIIFTHDKFQLNQSLLLSPSLNQYKLFTIDSFYLPTKEFGKIIKLIVKDRFNSNRYFISDSDSNVYLIEISWIKNIKTGFEQIKPTFIQQLIYGTNSDYNIQHIDLIQTNNNQQYLTIIINSQKKQNKELIFINLQTSKSDENSLCLFDSERLKDSFDFVDHINSLLIRDQTIPYIRLSRSSSFISNLDFEINLSKFIKILIEQYIKKQENVRKELEKKQNYLIDFHKKQFNHNKELNEKFELIQKRFQSLKNLFQQEISRRKRLSSNVNDLLSIIEQNTPILSDAEIRMKHQFETYEIQINYLKNNIKFLQEFILSSQNKDLFDNLSIKNIQNIVQNHRNQIDQIKSQLQTIHIHK